jgi:hypothetical protein
MSVGMISVKNTDYSHHPFTNSNHEVLSQLQCKGERQVRIPKKLLYNKSHGYDLADL